MERLRHRSVLGVGDNPSLLQHDSFVASQQDNRLVDRRILTSLNHNIVGYCNCNHCKYS